MNSNRKLLAFLALLACGGAMVWVVTREDQAGSPPKVLAIDDHASSGESLRESGLNSRLEPSVDKSASSSAPSAAPVIEKRESAAPKLPFEPGQPLPDPAMHLSSNSIATLRSALAKSPTLKELAKDLNAEDLKRVLELCKPELTEYERTHHMFNMTIARAVTTDMKFEGTEEYASFEAADQFIKQKYNQSRLCYVGSQAGANGSVFRPMSIDPELYPEAYWTLFERHQTSEILSARVHAVIIGGEYRR